MTVLCVGLRIEAMGAILYGRPRGRGPQWNQQLIIRLERVISNRTALALPGPL